MITYLKQSLFDVPKESIIIHACNAQGVWGRGIAKEFKARYPESFVYYNRFCNSGKDIIGLSSLSSWPISEPHWVGWIITSENYAEKTDPAELIKINTTLALDDLCKSIYSAHRKNEWKEIEVYSNKFNSGLFNVPWKDTELILETVLKRYKRIKWYVCDPNLGEKDA